MKVAMMPVAELPTTTNDSPSELLFLPTKKEEKKMPTRQITTTWLGGVGKRVSTVSDGTNGSLPDAIMDAAVDMCVNHERSIVFSSSDASYYCAPVRDPTHNNSVIGTIVAVGTRKQVPDALLAMLRSTTKK